MRLLPPVYCAQTGGVQAVWLSLLAAADVVQRCPAEDMVSRG